MEFTDTTPQPPSECILVIEAETSPTILKADKVESPTLAEATVMRRRSGKVLFRVLVILFMVAMLAIGVYVAVTVSHCSSKREKKRSQ